ncbi:MAG: hypothetical protein ACLQGP_12090 [Isosphaeraceae bacterium]
MSSATTAKPYTEVTLLRPDEAPQTFTLPEGATLADLLRAAGAAVRSPNMLIDGRPIEDMVILKTGMMITIVPEPPQVPPEKDWRRTVGMFQDTPFFRAMIAEGRAIREADREATLAELDAEQEDS